MQGRQEAGGAPVEALAAAHGADAWRLALVAGSDVASATRAALHALVVAAVEGGGAAERPAVLALSRSWALSNTGADRGAAGAEAGPAVAAFWSLPEALRSTLWCADELGLSAADVDRVVGPGAEAATAVARGRLRRSACRQHQAAVRGGGCAAVAPVLGPLLAGHASIAKAALVDAHAASCPDCAMLLASLRDPAAAVAASLPPAPGLVLPAARAWREHVGAPNRTLPDHVRRAAAAVGRRHRPVAAVLAVVTAGTFGSATSQLASSSERTVPPAAAATPPPRPATGLPRPAPVAPPQAVIPPLAAEAVADPGLWRVIAPELAVASPVTTVAPPPPTAPPPTVPAPALISEPPPAEDRSTTVDLSLPLAIPVPVQIEVGPACTSVTLGPLHLRLPCRG